MNSNASKSPLAQKKSVILFHYDNGAVLTENGTNIGYISPNQDDGVTTDSLEAKGKALCECKSEVFNHDNIVYLPLILSECWEYDDVIKLALYMGYLSPKENIFDFLSNTEHKFTLNSQEVDSGLTADWMHSLESKVMHFEAEQLFEKHIENIGDIAVWFVFAIKSQSRMFFTLKELANAEYNHDGEFWELKLNGIPMALRAIRQL